MCLTGVDYYSTLGYIPSIAFENCGWLAPIAILGIIFVTLFGALPVYRWVAWACPSGQGSIGMVERMARKGWIAKFAVIVLLGFAATDFIITITLSAADAAAHITENPMFRTVLERSGELNVFQFLPLLGVLLVGVALWGGWRKGIAFVGALIGMYIAVHIAGMIPHEWQQMWITSAMIIALGIVFWIGFSEAIMIAVTLVVVYMTMNAIIIGSGLLYIFNHPELIDRWWTGVTTGEWHAIHALPLGKSGNIFVILGTCLLLFPKLALGMSGFETGVAVMPLVKGNESDDPARPAGRIRNTGRLLATAAVIMSVFLLGSMIVVSMLIPPEAFEHGVEGAATAKDRALAYLAHGQTGLPISGLFGTVFGTIYDASTTSILWFAGASALAGLLNLVPLYMPGAGMAPEWVKLHRPQVVLFTVIALIVTAIFRASVSAQADAYATGVLALMTSACWAVSLQAGAQWSEVAAGDTKGWWKWMSITSAFRFITLLFVYTTGTVVYEKPVGMIIASVFIVATFIIAMVSRIVRSREIRHAGFRFISEAVETQWNNLVRNHTMILVPHRPDGRSLIMKELEIRKSHRIPDETAIIFLESTVSDSSQFASSPLINIREANGHIVIVATECTSVAHTIAAVTADLSNEQPMEVIFGWSDGGSWGHLFRFLFFGEGNVAVLVRELLVLAIPDEKKRPKIIVG